jgi:hypothetical protein
MKYLKLFEAYYTKCDRCNTPVEPDVLLTMSRFNNEMLCDKCKEEETNDPDYQLAFWRDEHQYHTDMMNNSSNKGDYETAAYHKKMADDYYNKIYNEN